MASVPTSLFNPPSGGDEEADSAAAARLTILAKVEAMEKGMQEDFKKIRHEIDKKYQSALGGHAKEYAKGASFSNAYKTNGTNGLGLWHVRGFNDIGLSSSCTWKPLRVREMPNLDSLPLSQQPLPLEKMKGFTIDDLIDILGGEEWADGIFYPAIGAKAHSKQLKRMMKSKTFYCFDSEVDPFLPSIPGQHGARLAVFFRQAEDDEELQNICKNVALFVSLPSKESISGERLYHYFGHYSQNKWSDKLDYDRVQEDVPTRVKEHWAEKLTRPDRPGWLEQEIMEHFWPVPVYDGTLREMDNENDKEDDEGDDSSTVVPSTEDHNVEVSVEYLKYYLHELAEWKKESRMKVKLLKKDHIMDAFAKEDAADEPGLRFWWEYLECVGFDRNFYYLLANAESEGQAEAEDSESS